jgi:hydrogenase nickel incorporation protein HypA/HybF
MHEFSLAADIVEIVTNAAQNANKEKVTSITLQIGDLAGVEKYALYTALESLMETPMLKAAKIVTETVTGKAICSECKFEFELNDLLAPCPKCEGYFKDIIEGKEFNVLSIDAE